MEIASRHPWSGRFRRECEAKSFQWIEGHWDRPSGMTQGVLIGPPNAQQSKVIAFLHGLGNDALYPFVGLFRHLLAAGWSIAACDIDGHGIGSTSKMSMASYQTCADDLIAFVAKHRPGRDRIHCAGFSFGAALMLNYAVRNPERIHSLTMIGMPLELSDHMPIVVEGSSIFRPNLATSIIDYGPIGIIPAFGSFNRRNYPIRLEGEHCSQYINRARVMFRELNATNALMVSTFPSLFMSGARDFIAPADPVIDLNIPLERLQVFRIPDETHFSSLFTPVAWKRMEIFLRTVRHQP